MELFPRIGLSRFFLALGSAYGLYFITSLLRGYMRRSALAARRRQHKAACTKALEEIQRNRYERPLPSDRVKYITSLTLEELSLKLQSQEVTAVEALHAYQTAAVAAHHKTNCLVEPIRNAEQLAIECDRQLKTGNAPPLCGVPVSLKENYSVKGYENTAGCSRYLGQISETDAVTVAALKQAGAVPFVRTNIPQTMLAWDTSNPIFGQTLHPLDNSRMVGGSSGGEACLISQNGSVLGFGSDIGGSIRIPANMCGIAGLKTTVGRFSSRGMNPIMKAQTNIPAAFGPMARDVGSLVVAMRSLMTPEHYKMDPQMIPLPFNEEMFAEKKKLKIGFYTFDGVFTAVPAQVRAVLETKKVLEDLGHEVVEWEVPHKSERRFVRIYAKTVMGDGGQWYRRAMADDAVDHSVKNVDTAAMVPKLVQRMLNPLVRLVGGKDLARAAIDVLGCESAAEWWDLSLQTSLFRQEVVDNWKKRGLDAIILPGFGTPAIKTAQSRFCTPAVSYTVFANVLNFPAGSLPVTHVTADDVQRLADYPTPDLAHKVVKKNNMGSEGLPVNVQVMTLPWTEERCLRLMLEIETELKKR